MSLILKTREGGRLSGINSRDAEKTDENLKMKGSEKKRMVGGTRKQEKKKGKT